MAQITLLDLPREVLCLIATQLCAHCNTSPDRPLIEKGTTFLRLSSFSCLYSRDAMTLSALSKTCRILRDLAQPILFHCAINRGAGTSSQRQQLGVEQRGASLLCALLQRPDLAQTVKVLLIPDEWYYENYWDITVWQHEILEDGWKAMMPKIDMKNRHVEPPPEDLFQGNSGDFSRQDDKSSFALRMASLLFDCVQHNITTLLVGDWIAYGHYLPPSLPCQAQIFHCGSWEADCAASILDMEDLMPILDISPALTTLAMDAIESWPVDLLNVYQNIQNLIIQAGWLSHTDFISLTKMMPKLSYLEYMHHHLCWNTTIYTNLGDALRPIHKTLKRLLFGISFLKSDSDADPIVHGLKQLQVLEELTLNHKAYDENIFPSCKDKSSLVHLLPTSTKKLIIMNWYDEEVLLMLAAAVDSHALPNLKLVIIKLAYPADFCQDEFNQVQEAFSKAGVAFVAEGHRINIDNFGYSDEKEKERYLDLEDESIVFSD